MADSSNLIRIKQIQTAAGIHDIDAKYVDGRLFSEVYAELEGMAHGVVDTYVIPLSNKGKDGYSTVVESEENTVEVSISVLNGLVNPENTSLKYKVGDVILIEETSDGVKIFDRWVSSVSDDKLTLSILETQVAKHHHEITSTTSNAITSVNADEYIVVPTVGADVNVLTSDNDIEVITSISYSENPDSDGGHNFEVVAGTSGDGVGHTHTISSHTHSAKFTPDTIVSERVSVYTSLSESTYTTHSHETTTVAGVATESDSDITYVTSGTSDSFIKTLTESSESTSVATSLSTSSETLSTIAQTSEDEIGTIDGVNTKTSGAHSHTVSVTTDSNVVTELSIAENVVTSVSLNYVAPDVQTDVVTSVTHTSTSVISSVDTSKSSFLTNLSVDENGVLSFTDSSAVIDVTPTTKTVVSEITVVSGTQSAGSASITSESYAQTYTSNKVSSTGSADEAGSHSHGFSHTHAIEGHSHTVSEHSHTYVKVSGETGDVITSLNTVSYTPHTHESVTVAGVAKDDSNITYVTGGSTTEVIGSLVDTDVTITVGDSGELTTDTKYYKLAGDIEFPGLSISKTKLTKTSVTPAVAGNEENKAIKSITQTSGTFVTGVDSVTSTNVGGEGVK
jgi:hypothetical protein